jgi:hypothetical protein
MILSRYFLNTDVFAEILFEYSCFCRYFLSIHVFVEIYFEYLCFCIITKNSNSTYSFNYNTVKLALKGTSI